jgi:CheY-like chemotaxis protein
MLELHAERVLLVEQPDGRDMLKLALEYAGLEVDVAHDGESALVIAAERGPAVVILDINLPRMDGWEVARRLRQHMGSRVRLIALTSRGDPEDYCAQHRRRLRRPSGEARAAGRCRTDDPRAARRVIETRVRRRSTVTCGA